jgi:hypothetical protein
MEICVRDSLFIPRGKLTVHGSDNFNSIIEMHTLLVTLIRQFEFALPDDPPKIKRLRPGLVMPVIEGEEHKGTQLPLKITSLKNE